MQIENGAGNGTRAKVDGNYRLHTAAIVESEAEHSTEIGDGYNLNTGILPLTTSNESALMYIKNNEDDDLVLDFCVIGIDNAGTVDSLPIWKIVKNPTGGTIVSDATDTSINQNRNFGSSKTLSADVYSGGEGKTATGGTDALLGYAVDGQRTELRIAMDMPSGSSMAICLDPQTSAGTTNCYVAVICHKKDSNNKD